MVAASVSIRSRLNKQRSPAARRMKGPNIYAQWCNGCWHPYRSIVAPPSPHLVRLPMPNSVNPRFHPVALDPSNRLDLARIHPAGRELMPAERQITGQAGAMAISPGPQARGRHERTSGLACVLLWGAQLGEAPARHPGEQQLYRVDILHPAVYRFDPETGVNEACDPGRLVGAILFGADGNKRVASHDGIETLDFDSRRLFPYVDPEDGVVRKRGQNNRQCRPAGDGRIQPPIFRRVQHVQADGTISGAGVHDQTGVFPLRRFDSSIGNTESVHWQQRAKHPNCTAVAMVLEMDWRQAWWAHSVNCRTSVVQRFQTGNRSVLAATSFSASGSGLAVRTVLRTRATAGPHSHRLGRSGCQDRIVLDRHQRVNPRRPQEPTRLQLISPRPSRR